MTPQRTDVRSTRKIITDLGTLVERGIVTDGVQLPPGFKLAQLVQLAFSRLTARVTLGIDETDRCTTTAYPPIAMTSHDCAIAQFEQQPGQVFISGDTGLQSVQGMLEGLMQGSSRIIAQSIDDATGFFVGGARSIVVENDHIGAAFIAPAIGQRFTSLLDHGFTAVGIIENWGYAAVRANETGEAGKKIYLLKFQTAAELAIKGTFGVHEWTDTDALSSRIIDLPGRMTIPQTADMPLTVLTADGKPATEYVKLDTNTASLTSSVPANAELGNVRFRGPTGNAEFVVDVDVEVGRQSQTLVIAGATGFRNAATKAAEIAPQVQV